MVSLHRDTGYQHLDTLDFSGSAAISGLLVKLRQVPFLVKLSTGPPTRIVAPNGHIDPLITNDLENKTICFVAENKNNVRWQIEEFHRSFKNSRVPNGVNVVMFRPNGIIWPVAITPGFLSKPKR